MLIILKEMILQVNKNIKINIKIIVNIKEIELQILKKIKKVIIWLIHVIIILIEMKIY